MPISVALGLVSYVPAAIAWCGLYGCSVPVDSMHHLPGSTLAVLGVGGVVAALPLLIVPWHVNPRTRTKVALAFAVLFVVVGSVYLVFIVEFPRIIL